MKSRYPTYLLFVHLFLVPSATVITVEKVKLAVAPQLIPMKLAGETDVARLVTDKGD